MPKEAAIARLFTGFSEPRFPASMIGCRFGALGSGVRQSLELVDRVEDGGDCRSFLGTDLRTPDVEQKDDPKFARRVHGFMLEAVVEDEQLALVPLARFVADAKPAAGGHD